MRKQKVGHRLADAMIANRTGFESRSGLASCSVTMRFAVRNFAVLNHWSPAGLAGCFSPTAPFAAVAARLRAAAFPVASDPGSSAADCAPGLPDPPAVWIG